MEEGRLPKEFMKWSLPGRRKRGRPKLSWAEGIRGLMGEKGLVEIRNTIIKQKMNVTRSLLDDINTKQLKGYGHVQRMEEGRLPKQAVKWNPPGRRKRGRPKLSWAEVIR